MLIITARSVISLSNIGLLHKLFMCLCLYWYHQVSFHSWALSNSVPLYHFDESMSNMLQQAPTHLIGVFLSIPVSYFNQNCSVALLLEVKIFLEKFIIFLTDGMIKGQKVAKQLLQFLVISVNYQVEGVITITYVYIYMYICPCLCAWSCKIRGLKTTMVQLSASLHWHACTHTDT